MDELPAYLENIVQEAVEYYEVAGEAPTGAAHEIATRHAIFANRQPIGILEDMRDLDSLCGDELETYTAHGPGDSHATRVVRGLATRSVEEFLAEQLTAYRDEGHESLPIN